MRAVSRKVQHEPHAHEQPVQPGSRPTRFRPEPIESSGRQPAPMRGEFALPKPVTPALPAVEAFSRLDLPGAC